MLMLTHRRFSKSLLVEKREKKQDKYTSWSVNVAPWSTENGHLDSSCSLGGIFGW